jgi:hypothetical protein
MKYSTRPSHYAPHKRTGISSKNAPHSNAPHSKQVAHSGLFRLSQQLRGMFTLAGHK